MGLLRLITQTAVATAASQTNIAAATALAVKLRVRGQMFLNLAANSFDQAGLLRIWDGTSAEKVLLTLRETGNSFAVWADHVVASDAARTTAIARASIDPAKFYVIYAHWRNGTSPQGVCEVYDDTNTLLGSQTPVTYNWGALPTGRGVVVLGKWSPFLTPTDRLDGVALYSDVLAGAARYSEPLPADANLLALWRMQNSSGNTITATVGNDLTLTGTEATDFAWETGGAWPSAGLARAACERFLLGGTPGF